MQLSKRIDLIRKLVERSSLSKNLNKQVREVWAEVESLAKLRNDIAHSPIVFGWHGPEEDRPPDFIGSFNAKKLKSKKPRTAPLVDLKKLNFGIDNVAKVAQQLHDLLDKVIAELNPNPALNTDAPTSDA